MSNGQQPFEAMLTGTQGLKALYGRQQMVAQHLLQQQLLHHHHAEDSDVDMLSVAKLSEARARIFFMCVRVLPKDRGGSPRPSSRGGGRAPMLIREL